jgi:TP901-1 family phage major tail protein
MAVNNANLISIFLQGPNATSYEKVAVATSHDFDLTKETIEVTSKDSGGVAEYQSGKQDGTLSVEGYVDPSKGNYSRLFNLIKGSKVVKFRVSDGVSTNFRYVGDAIVTNLNRAGENDSPESFSAELQITGDVTEEQIP